jgi:hypothetical protein
VSLSQLVSTPQPSGETRPKPVMTTRRIACCSRFFREPVVEPSSRYNRRDEAA